MNGDGKMMHDIWFPQTRTSLNTEEILELVSSLRIFVDELPDTSLSFELSRFTNSVDEYHPSHINKDMIDMLNLWELPDVFKSDGARIRYVNPNYKDAHMFPDVYTKCECGALVVHSNKDISWRGMDNKLDHTDECCSLFRLRARVRLLEKRQEVMERCIPLGVKGSELAPRFAVRSKVMASIAYRVDLDITDLFREYQIRSGNTYAYLTNQGVSAELIADAYGKSIKTMGTNARKYAGNEYDHKKDKWIISGDREMPEFIINSRFTEATL